MKMFKQFVLAIGLVAPIGLGAASAAADSEAVQYLSLDEVKTDDSTVGAIAWIVAGSIFEDVGAGGLSGQELGGEASAPINTAWSNALTPDVKRDVFLRVQRIMRMLEPASIAERVDAGKIYLKVFFEQCFKSHLADTPADELKKGCAIVQIDIIKDLEEKIIDATAEQVWAFNEILQYIRECFCDTWAAAAPGRERPTLRAFRFELM